MKFHLPLLMLAALLLSSCAAGGLSRAFSGQSLTLSYDDFGTEKMAAPFLGPRGAHTVVIAHYGFRNITPAGPEDVRYVNVLQSLNYLRQQVRNLPATAANEPLRQRLRSTYARLYPLQLRRYNTALNGSYLQPFGGLDRRLMLPALPPPEI